MTQKAPGSQPPRVGKAYTSSQQVQPRATKIAASPSSKPLKNALPQPTARQPIKTVQGARHQQARAAQELGTSLPKISATTSKVAPTQIMDQRHHTKPPTPWTVEAASRIYKAYALDNGGKIKKGTFPAEAMSKAMKTRHMPMAPK